MARLIKGTGTEKTPPASFGGESQAQNRCTFFASVARSECYEQPANILTATTGNEQRHAEIFFK